MQSPEKKTYIQFVKGIFSNPYKPAFVRLNRMQAFLVGLLLSVMLCLPASVVIGICWLISPKEDSIFLFMSVPWCLAPLIILCVYVNNYKAPKKNDKTIRKLFALVRTDTPISSLSGCCYTFTKNGFLFEPVFETEPVFRKNGTKKKDLKLLIIDMKYDCDYESLEDYHRLAGDITAYLDEKPIGSYIKLCYHAFYMRIDVAYLLPELVKDIVDEFIYLTERFNLRPITPVAYAEGIQKIAKLKAKEKN